VRTYCGDDFLFFPYERLNIAIKWETIIRIIAASVPLGVGIRLLVVYASSH